ncbi:cysteine hydrolase family protein [Acinetobacter populi]|uniref:Cysteine hydrolase n=1 Tax=Acinetobacter populi TaxID=1582270 RepID=A0A1Z9YVN2_9GAMM|nr:cysteine hydrolase family protein [Acinetobacter populi]OUY06278.1 cysteine hydrolase [Acinetobacter populi]
MKQALLIIDVQNDYFKAGDMELVEPEQALMQINQLEDHFLKQSLPIIYVQHIAASDAPFFRENSNGVQLHQDLRYTTDAILVAKKYPNSFYQTRLQQILLEQGIEQLVIVGMMTHMCIDSTTRAAKELGYQPILISDATATRTLQFDGQTVAAHQVQLAYLSALSNFADIQTTHDYLYS